MYELFTKIQAAKTFLTKSGVSDEPSLEDVADHLGITAERVNEILQLARQPASLDFPTGGDDDEKNTLQDTLEVRQIKGGRGEGGRGEGGGQWKGEGWLGWAGAA